MKLYNSLTLQVEEFKPVHENQVNMYVCGPTVYNHAHIGNARPIVVFDTLRRVFEADGYKVKYVSNFTDVDDKIINKALEEGVKETEIADRYIEAYNKVRESLNTETLDATPRVTETMDEMIKFIEKLVENGNAYVVDGEVYFAVDSVPSYGELSHQNTDDLMVGARVEENDKKRNPLDFLLWKKTNVGIQWDSPWGKGRPGWHTECVVMIGDNFNHELIDIHGGGKDLKFPHHENEMAQSNAVNHHHLANYWVHNGMLNFNGGKMSKSLGNIQLAKDVIAQIGPNVARWLLLSVNYRDVLNFSEETLEAARTELAKIEQALHQAEVKAQLANASLEGELDAHWNDFMEAMRDDLNTPNAYKVIFDTVKELNQSLRQRRIDFAVVASHYSSVKKMLSVLGVFIDEIVLSDEDRELYAKWNEAKAAKDFETADKYRAQLQERHII
ncbi:MAG: cysteine--tRNA ligase [Erysipelotrichaceae bacterium]|nr:cysteine--tRNA ligase [Erysipelotrichaceae bacterium]